jgi:hypothetical protein
LEPIRCCVFQALFRLLRDLASHVLPKSGGGVTRGFVRRGARR